MVVHLSVLHLCVWDCMHCTCVMHGKCTFACVYAREQFDEREVNMVAGRRSGSDGTPDRALSVWMVVAPKGTSLLATAVHPRAGTATAAISLA